MKVWITPSSTGVQTLAYDSDAGGFQTGFSGTATARQSPGSGVNDEMVLEINRATDYVSKETILVEWEADSSLCGAPVQGSYSFEIEDLTAPELESIFWLTPLKCRIKFNEPVVQTSAAGSALYVNSFYGSVEIVANNQLRIPGTSLSADMVGYYISVAGSAYPQNNGPQIISGINTTTGIVTVSGTPYVVDDGRDVNEADVVVRRRYLRATVSPYKFTARLTEEGTTKSETHEDRIQCAYEAIPVLAETVPEDELQAGENAAEYIYLTIDQHISFSRLYKLTAVLIEDLWGNAMSGASSELDFTSPSFGMPSDRVTMWSNGILSPPLKQRDLEHEGEQRKMAVVLQDVKNLLWYEIDQLQHLHEPDLCKETWIDHLNYNQGNPFRFPLETTLMKRKLGAALRKLYARVGTREGIIDMVYDLLGVVITIHPYLAEQAWILGDATYGILGETTILGISTPFGRNCYEIHTTATLDTDEFRIIRDIARWADPPNMHLVRIVDAATTVDYIDVDLFPFNVEPAE
jgi:hypothetical protein